jgi:phage-related protein (TIGR01555 family)
MAVTKTLSDVAFRVADGLRNLVSGVGTAKDKSTQWGYFYTPTPADHLFAMYATDWLARKIIDVPAEDMTREWRNWETKRAEAIYEAEAELKIRTKVRQAKTLARLYGGSAILIGTDVGTDPAAAREPLDYESIRRGDLRYLRVFHRHDLATSEWVEDVQDEAYGKPLYYRVKRSQQIAGAPVDIHRSRFVFFNGPEVGELFDGRNFGWGQPVLEIIARQIVNLQGSAMNAAALTNEAKIDIIKIPGLNEILADKTTTGILTERLSYAGAMKSTINTLLLGNDEEFDRKEVNFGGLPDLLRTNMEMTSGAADIPLTRLFGVSPGGLNATGDSDIRNYYDRLANEQETKLKEELEPLDEVLVRHVLGTRPDSVVYEWNPLWQLSEAEKATRDKTKADTVGVYHNLGLFAPEELRPAVFDMLMADGFLPSLDEHLLSDDELKRLMEEEAQRQAEIEGGGQPPAEEEEPQVPQLQVIRGGRSDHRPFDVDDHTPGGKEHDQSEHAWNKGTGKPDLSLSSAKSSTKPKGEAAVKWLKQQVEKAKSFDVKNVYPPAGSPEELAKRYAKRLKAPAAKNGKYRNYLLGMLNEAKTFGTLTPEWEAGVLEKIGESFWEEAKYKFETGDQELGKKLYEKAQMLGFESPDLKAAKAAEKKGTFDPWDPNDEPIGSDPSEEEAELAASKAAKNAPPPLSKSEKEFKGPDPIATSKPNIKPILAAASPATPSEVLAPKKLDTPAKKEAAWKALTFGQKSMAEDAYVEKEVATYLNGEVEKFKEFNEGKLPSGSEIAALKENAEQLARDDWTTMDAVGRVDWIEKNVPPSDPLFEALHPRGAGGQFVEKPGSDEDAAAKVSNLNGDQMEEAWNNLSGEEKQRAGEAFVAFMLAEEAATHPDDAWATWNDSDQTQKIEALSGVLLPDDPIWGSLLQGVSGLEADWEAIGEELSLAPEPPIKLFGASGDPELVKAWAALGGDIKSTVRENWLEQNDGDYNAWINLSDVEKLKWAYNEGWLPSDVYAQVGSLLGAGGPVPIPKAAPVIESADGWAKIGPQKGSNPGGTYEAPDGEYYVKTPKTEDHVKNDLLANNLYQWAGVRVPSEKMVTLGGKPSIASKMLGKGMTLGELGKSVPEEVIKEIQAGFAMDAWLANWDAVGTGKDNILVTQGKVYRVDTGGALKYRAQGGPKEFKGDVPEWDTLRDPTKNPDAASVFKDMTPLQLVSSIDTVLAISDEAINVLTEKFGVPELADPLITRKGVLKAKQEQLKKQIAPPMAAATKTPLDKTTLTVAQQKVVKTTPIPEPYGSVNSPAIKAFNTKWSGVPVETKEDLAAKEADYTKMKADLQKEQAAKESTAAAEVKAKVAQMSAAKKAKWGIDTPEEEEAYASMKALLGNDGYADSYMDRAVTLKDKPTIKKSNLSTVEIATILAYTGSAGADQPLYKVINKQLRSNAATVETFKFANSFERALVKLPDYSGPGEVVRRTTVPETELAKMQPGYVHTEWGFMSAAKKDIGWSGKHTLHITKHSTGSDVASMSSSGSHEAEIIFARNTSFIVTKRDGNHIWLEEVASTKHMIQQFQKKAV